MLFRSVITSRDVDLLEAIGHGGFTQMYKANWGGTLVAVKKFDADLPGEVGIP